MPAVCHYRTPIERASLGAFCLAAGLAVPGGSAATRIFSSFLPLIGVTLLAVWTLLLVGSDLLLKPFALSLEQAVLRCGCAAVAAACAASRRRVG